MSNEENLRWQERFRCREKEALAEAIDHFGLSIQRLVNRILAGVGLAEDVEECVSDVFLAAWNSIDQYDEHRGSFQTWLMILAKYKALDLRRKLVRQRGRTSFMVDTGVLRDSFSTEQEALSRESTREIVAWVQELDEPDRSLFWRRYFYYESLDELVVLFNMTKKAIESRLYRCRTALKQRVIKAEARLKGGKYSG